MINQAHWHEQAGTATLERRSEPRFKAGHSVVMKPSHAHPMEAYLIDVSSRGTRVRVPEPVPVGAQVRIESKGLLLFGTITRCELTHGAYEAGVALALPVEMLGELEKLNAAISAEC
jgi:hypothetical protein